MTCAPKPLKTSLFCLMGVGLILSGGCSHKSKPYTPDLTPVKSPEQLYGEAEVLLVKKSYGQAAKNFEDIDKQHAFTATARRALLKASEAYYVNQDYDKAADSAQRYIMLNPNEGDIAYAYYIYGLSNYGQIKDHHRDLDPALRALKAFSHMLKTNQKSPYIKDAEAKIVILQEMLAAKEMEIGRYYLKNNNYTGAVNRFRAVLALYPMTQHMPEALLRLTEVYMRLGVFPEAQATAAILVQKYPDSSWAKAALTILQKYELSPAAGQNSSRDKLLQKTAQPSTEAP